MKPKQIARATTWYVLKPSTKATPLKQEHPFVWFLLFTLKLVLVSAFIGWLLPSDRR